MSGFRVWVSGFWVVRLFVLIIGVGGWVVKGENIISMDRMDVLIERLLCYNYFVN